VLAVLGQAHREARAGRLSGSGPLAVGKEPGGSGSQALRQSGRGPSRGARRFPESPRQRLTVRLGPSRSAAARLPVPGPVSLTRTERGPSVAADAGHFGRTPPFPRCAVAAAQQCFRGRTAAHRDWHWPGPGAGESDGAGESARRDTVRGRGRGPAPVRYDSEPRMRPGEHFRVRVRPGGGRRTPGRLGSSCHRTGTPVRVCQA
jgi:hypothetical protein